MRFVYYGLSIVLFLAVQFCFAGPMPPTDKQIEQRLRAGTSEERTAVLLSMGIGKELAEHYGDFEASMSGEIAWLPLPTANGSLLFLPCQDESGMAALFLVTKTAKGWRARDEQDADCHYTGNVSVEVIEGLVPAKEVVLLHQVCVGHGTGYVEHSLQAFTVYAGKFRPVVGIPEFLYSAGPEGEVGSQQRSVFVPIVNATSGVLEETRVTGSLAADTDQPFGPLKVERRVWRWSRRRQRFQATRFWTLSPTKSVKSNLRGDGTVGR